MKSYKHLMKDLQSDDNIRLAMHNSSLGKHDHEEVIKMEQNVDAYIPKFQRMCCHYTNSLHNPKVIYDGISRKQRRILVPTHREQVMHHMVVNVLKPIFMRSMYEHSYGSIPGRGSHMAKKRIDKWIRTDVRNTKYCLKMDIRKYFDSIPHDILKEKLSKIIKDEDFLRVLFTIIEVQKVGIPLGFHTSQWLANFYLTDLDHYIKEQLKAIYYVRYMDDMVIFGSNKRVLHKMRIAIEDYLRVELGLDMKDNWQIFKIEYVDGNGNSHGRALDFMGFRFYRNRTTLRRKIMLRMSRKARAIAKKGTATIYDCKQMLAYVGWISVTNVYGFYVKWIKPFVNIQNCKRKVSNYDRRKNKCGTMPNTAHVL